MLSVKSKPQDQQLLVDVQPQLTISTPTTREGLKIPIISQDKCPFCKIFDGDVGRNVIVATAKAGTLGPQQKVDILVVEDFVPYFERHLLIIPGGHTPTCLADLNQSHHPLLQDMRALGRTVIPDPDLEGFHTFPSIYHLHMHLIKGKPVTARTEHVFQFPNTIEDCFLRPLPVEDYHSNFAPFDLIETALVQGKDMKTLQTLTATRSRLHPLDHHIPAYAHLFKDSDGADETCAIELKLGVT